MSGATSLVEIQCEDNQLNSLNVSGATSLVALQCENNKLASLDVSKNPALMVLYCQSNQLTSLNVSGATALCGLHCFNNQIKGAEMDKLVNSLPINDEFGKELWVYGGEKDGNVCTTVQVAVAKSRGWIPIYYDEDTWESGEYEGSNPSGIAGIVGNSNETAPVYNLSGQRLSAPQKGINFVNGKKVMILHR